MNYKVAPPLVDILGSTAKIRILNLLAKRGELNITAIVRLTRLNHSRAQIHLKELVKMEIIREKLFGRIKIYEINDNWEVGYKIKKFLIDWELLHRNKRED